MGGTTAPVAEVAVERRTLSSAQTFLWKWFFAPFWITGFGFATLQVWQENPPADPDMPIPLAPRWVLLVAWVAGSAVIYWLVARLKRVRVDAAQLWISNYRREIVVPLSDVTGIRQTRWVSPPQAIVQLRRDHGLGDEFRFMLRAKLYLPWRPHPDVKWLREVTTKAGGLRQDA